MQMQRGGRYVECADVDDETKGGCRGLVDDDERRDADAGVDSMLR